MYLEDEGQAFSEADTVVGIENPDVAGFQTGVVDEGAVFAAEVMQQVVLANTGDLGMAAGNREIIDREVRTGVAAYGGDACLIELCCCPDRCTL